MGMTDFGPYSFNRRKSWMKNRHTLHDLFMAVTLRLGWECSASNGLIDRRQLIPACDGKLRSIGLDMWQTDGVQTVPGANTRTTTTKVSVCERVSIHVLRSMQQQVCRIAAGAYPSP